MTLRNSIKGVNMKNTRLISSKLIQLATPTDLGEKARKAITQSINQLVADSFALYIKTKNFHWHVSGRHYRDYHLLLDEQADQIFAMIDVLAERVRKLGGTTIRSIGSIARLKEIADDDDEFVLPLNMIRRLLKDNQHFAAKIREAHQVCDQYADVATASILEVYLDETERRIWFLFETQTDEK
jgi:starvation-inducible DNA-binding protein